MKIQLEICFLCLKRTFKWYLIMILTSLIYIISINFIREIEASDLMILLGNFNLKDLSFFGTLVMIYHYSFTIYFSYLFYSYEIDKGLYNILLRSNCKKWIKSKFIVQLFGIFALRLLYYLVILLITNFNIKIYAITIITSLSTHILLSIFIIFFYNHINKNIKIIFCIIILCFVEIIFNNFLLFPNIIISLIILVYEIFNFNYKKIILHRSLSNV